MNRPLIGICTDHVDCVTPGGKDRSYLKLYPAYVQSVIAAGGIPLVLPVVDDIADIAPLLKSVSGVVMIGADDYPPQWYGGKPHPKEEYCTPQRASFDRALAAYLFDHTDLPLLLICGGMQLACILSGGAMEQHLPDLPGRVEHRDFRDQPQTTSHPIKIDTGSLLHRALGVAGTTVNSMHHQACLNPGPRLRVSAWATDGTIEALEFRDHRWRVGTQWHPERMGSDAVMPNLWNAFVAAAGNQSLSP